MIMRTETGRSWPLGYLALCLFWLAGLPALGVEFKSGENVTIGSGETVHDDVYLTGDTMTVEGRVVGDVVAAGRVLVIKGVVEGDLIAAAQAIVIQGEVTDDVRIAGMALKLGSGSRVGDDLFAAGFSLESETGSTVEGKTGFTGYQAVLSGQHGQGLESSLVALRLEGVVLGDVDATVESEAGPAWWTRFMQSPVALPVVAPGLTVTDGAQINGNLNYQSVAAATIGSQADVTGEVTRVSPNIKVAERQGWGTRLGKSLRWLTVLLLLGWVLIWIMPDKISGVSGTLAGRPAASLGWGVVTLLGFPVAMVLILVLTSVATMAFGMLSLGAGAALTLVVGLMAELILAAKFWIASYYLAPIVVGLVGGRWLLARLGVENSRYLGLLVGLVIWSALTLPPILGPLVRVAVVVVGLGASALWSVRYLARAESP